MSAPLKPWEKEVFETLGNQLDNREQWSATMTSTQKNGNPPPLPPRPQRDNWSRFGSSMSSYSPFGFGCSSPYYGGMYGGGLGGYGGYGSYGYNRFSGFGSSYGGSNENDFFRIAEEGSRQAFQSIESIVQAFASVSTMLESTYFALHSSFRAVLGVAEHMSNLKDHLSMVISSLSLLRGIRYVLRTILYYLGILKRQQNEEQVWKVAEATANENINNDAILKSLASDSRSSWPILVFFAVVCGTPWLFWRLIASISGKTAKASDKWKTGESDHYVATALYDFQTDSSKEVPFKAGQQIVIAPQNLQPRVRGWLLACVDNKTGLIPNNYIKIIGFNKINKNNEEMKPET